MPEQVLVLPDTPSYSTAAGPKLEELLPKKVLEEEKPSSNVRIYTPSVLLKQGQIEAQVFNNLYTQTAWFDEAGNKENLNSRATYMTDLCYILYGISPSGRINIGLDLNFQSVRIDEENSNPLAVYKFENTLNTRTAITYVGPKVKIAPFEGKRFSVQSAFWFPATNNLEGLPVSGGTKPFLAFDRNTWWTQFFFDKPVGSKFQFFSSADVLWRIPRSGSQRGETATPVSFFVNYFLSEKATVYVSNQYWPVWSWYNSTGDNYKRRLMQMGYFYQAGLGGKYQISQQIYLEFLYTKFLAGNSQGAGQTYNFGIRFLK